MTGGQGGWGESDGSAMTANVMADVMNVMWIMVSVMVVICFVIAVGIIFTTRKQKIDADASTTGIGNSKIGGGKIQ